MSSDFPKPKKLLFETKLTDVTDTDVEGVGAIREDIHGNIYRWVQNNDATNTTAAQYAPTCYDGAVRTKCVQPATALLPNLAGAWQAEITGQKYGWIQVQGTGSVIVQRTASATNATYGSLAALTPFVGANGADYLVVTNALAANYVGPQVSVQSLASNDTTMGQASDASTATTTYNCVFSCKL